MRSPRTLRLGLAAALLLSPAIAAAAEPVTRPSQLSTDEVREVLARHNAARDAVGVPALAWSTELADYAQAWADEIARTGTFEHRPSHPNASRFYGENLAAGFGPGYGVTAAVEQWRSEEKSYVTGMPIPELPEDFAKFEAGHYTQMVWRDTRAVGVGKAVIQTGDLAGWTVFVANYDPPGNHSGRKPY